MKRRELSEFLIKNHKDQIKQQYDLYKENDSYMFIPIYIRLKQFNAQYVLSGINIGDVSFKDLTELEHKLTLMYGSDRKPLKLMKNKICENIISRHDKNSKFVLVIFPSNGHTEFFILDDDFNLM